jgi:hypothetical protein
VGGRPARAGLVLPDAELERLADHHLPWTLRIRGSSPADSPPR